MRSRSLPAALAAILAIGCASAYDQTYQREMENLQSEQRARDAAESAAHAEARKYAAVVYFDVGSAVIETTRLITEPTREVLEVMNLFRALGVSRVSTGEELF